MGNCCFCPQVAPRRGSTPTPPGTSDCVSFVGTWDTTDDILVNTGIPFDPTLTFSPPPTSFLPPCGTPVKAACVTAQPGLTHATNPPSIDPYAVEKLSGPTGCTFKVAFACPFKGDICFLFCCQNACTPG